MTELQKRLRISFPEQENQAPKPGEYWRLNYSYNDGGRSEAGYKGDADDCVTRAISIVLQEGGYTDLPAGECYQMIYDEVTAAQKEYHANSRSKKLSKKAGTARDGVYKKVSKELFKEYGGEWKATMQIGSGCQVHMRTDELPSGLLILNISKHVTVINNHKILDTFNPDREGTRCVYGYWKFN